MWDVQHVTSVSLVGVEFSSESIAGPLAVRILSGPLGGTKPPASARIAESDLDVLQTLKNNKLLITETDEYVYQMMCICP